MSLCRVEHNKSNPYTTINTTIAEDDRLSWKAKGIWLYAFSRPNDWQFYISDLVNRSTDGEKSIYAALKELHDAGYLKKTQKRNDDGKMGLMEWTFYETSQIILPQPQKRHAVQRDAANGGLLNNKYILNKKDNNTPPAKEAAPVVVFSIFKKLNIPHSMSVKLSEQMNAVKAHQLVKRVLSWDGRSSDAVACNTILNQWDTWKDNVPKEEVFEENKAWAAEKLKSHDEQMVGFYKCVILNKYVEFCAGGNHQPKCFMYEHVSFKGEVTDFIEKNLK